MSIYDNAGVVLIPSGTKASKLYSVLPANGDGDFTHDRNLTTATRVNKDGFIEGVAADVPRLDYPLIDGVVQDCPHLLLEPQRTNLVFRSEEFDNSYWTKSNATVTANQAISPDGSQTSDEINDNGDSGTGVVGFYRNVTISSNQTYTLSVFAKKGSVDFISLRNENFTTPNNSVSYFNISNGTLGTVDVDHSAKIENFGNGWYRCSITLTFGTDTSGRIVIRLNESNNNTNVTRDGTKNVYLWGAMFEQGSYQTSYIKTTSNQATRSADVCNGSGTSAEFNDSEGVLFTEIAALANSGGLREIAVSNGSNSQAVQIKYTSTDNRINGTIATTSGTIGMTFDVPSLLHYHKVCLKYKASDFALWVDGFEVNTNTTINDTPSSLNQLDFDRADGVNDFYGKTKQLITFKTALTDSELETLTSWDSFNAMAKGQLYTIE